MLTRTILSPRRRPVRGALKRPLTRVLACATLLAGCLTTVVVGPQTAQAATPVLLRDPYLTDVSGAAAMVNVATNTTTPVPVVRWGLASGNCSTPPNTVTSTFVTNFNTHDKQFKAPLTGLAAGTRYCYRVIQSGVDLLGTAPVFTSGLAAGDTTPFSFAVIGDFGTGSLAEHNILHQIGLAQPGFIVTVGDNAYPNGTQSDYGDLTGGHVFGPGLWPEVGRTIPAFPAQGNHGFDKSLPYLQNWPQDATIAACQASGCRNAQSSYCCTAELGATHFTYASTWYAFDWGNSRFYVLEGAWSDKEGTYKGDFDGHLNGPVPGCGPCGTELTWLQSDLASHSTAHKFAFFHYPLHSDSSDNKSDTLLDGATKLEGVLANNGVNIVFNGHAHIYERNLPTIAGSPMVSYITGGGGAALGHPVAHSSFDAFAQGINEFLLVTVNGSSVTVTPTNQVGGTFDVQTYSF